MQVKRTPVSLTEDERSAIEKAMAHHGIRSMSDFLRFAALYVAKKALNPDEQ